MLQSLFYLCRDIFCCNVRKFPAAAPREMKSPVNTDDSFTLLDLWPLPHQAVRKGQRSIRLPEAGGTVGKAGGSRVLWWEGDPCGLLLPSPSEVSGKVVSNWRLCPGYLLRPHHCLRFDRTQVWSERNLTARLNFQILPMVSNKIAAEKVAPKWLTKRFHILINFEEWLLKKFILGLNPLKYVLGANELNCCWEINNRSWSN